MDVLSVSELFFVKRMLFMFYTKMDLKFNKA